MRTRCSRWPITACAAALHQPDCCRQATRAAVARQLMKPWRIARRDWACGRGLRMTDGNPDVVIACCGDVPTHGGAGRGYASARAGSRSAIRVVNVVDLMSLQPTSEHPHGLPDEEYDEIFPPDTPVVFAFHGYPWLHSPAHLPAAQSRQSSRARIQGRRHHDDAVRYVRAE